MAQDHEDPFGLGEDEPTEQDELDTEASVEDEPVGEVEQVTEASAEPASVETSNEPVETAEQKAVREKVEQEAADKLAADKLAEFAVEADSTLGSEDRDVTTGTLPVSIVSNLKTKYLALPTAKVKAAARQHLQDKMQEAMLAGTEDGAQYVVARTYLQLFNELKDAKATKGSGMAVAKVDPTVAFVERVASLMLAPNLVPVADEVADNWADEVEKLVESLQDQVVAFRNYQAAEAEYAVTLAAWEAKENKADDETAPEAPAKPEISQVVEAAARIAQGRQTGTRAAKAGSTSGGTKAPRVASNGHRGDVGKHLAEVFGRPEIKVGQFLSITDMVKVVTSQYGGDKNPPSPGAIASKLDKNIDMPFLRPEIQGKRGAVKVS